MVLIREFFPRTISRHRLTPDQVAYVVAGMRELPAHPDVEPAMRVLHEGGVRISRLTNGAPEVVESFLARNGLDGLVETVITTSELQAWKPPPRFICTPPANWAWRRSRSAWSRATPGTATAPSRPA